MRIKEFAALSRRIARTRVLVVGDPCLDEYVYGLGETVAQEAPVLSLEGERRVFAPGQATNVAANAAALGARVRFFGLAGADETSDRLAALLATMSVDAAGMITAAGRQTAYKTKFIAGGPQKHGQHVFHCYWQDRRPANVRTAARLCAAVTAALGDADVLVLSDYDNGTVTPAVVKRLLDEARRLGVPTVANGRGDLRKFRGANVVVGNVAELAMLVKRPLGPADVAAALAPATGRLAAERLVVTAGGAGLYYWPAGGGGRPRYLPSAARDVVDVTGAGDTLTAALAVGLAAGLPWDDALTWANAAAAVAVGEEGTATATAAEVRARVQEKA